MIKRQIGFPIKPPRGFWVAIFDFYRKRALMVLFAEKVNDVHPIYWCHGDILGTA